ncbi:MAG: hypothetical protein M5R36_00050 [Deltaproteobacteria bacterium]|nr:hypothetical protein [Deltaproteobacteria bacterium]
MSARPPHASPDATENRRSRRAGLAIAGFLYLALALFITWPVVTDPSRLVIGGDHTDIWKHLWGWWRTDRAIFHYHELPYAVRDVNHPSHGVLYHIDFLNSLIVIPLSRMFGMILGANLLIWGQLVAGALAMFALARDFVGRQIPAFVSGLIYGFAPYVLTLGLASGVSERMNLAWMPLFFLAVFRLLNRYRLRYFLGAGAAFFLAALGCWKYAMFIYVLMVFSPPIGSSFPSCRCCSAIVDTRSHCAINTENLFCTG